MKGSNTIKINHATMIEAMQCYLTTQFQGSQVPKVKSVSHLPNAAGWFEVSLESPVTSESESES